MGCRVGALSASFASFFWRFLKLDVLIPRVSGLDTSWEDLFCGKQVGIAWRGLSWLNTDGTGLGLLAEIFAIFVPKGHLGCGRPPETRI